MQAIKLSILMTTTAVAIAGCAQVLELDKPFEVADKVGIADHEGSAGGAGGTGGAPGSSESIDPCSLEPMRACYPGPIATANIGICKLGMQTCSTGAFGPCEGAIIPTTETCNGLDDDCDGIVDNPDVLTSCTCTPQTPMDCTYCSDSCFFAATELHTPYATVLEPHVATLGVSQKEEFIRASPVLEQLCCEWKSGVQVCLPDGTAWGPCTAL